jgi:cbb3-type cytochrome oxidase subunit 3
MDINTIRILVTLATFGGFLVIVAWAWWPSKRERFERDARLALDDDGQDARQ